MLTGTIALQCNLSSQATAIGAATPGRD